MNTPKQYKIILMGFHQLICDILKYVESETESTIVGVVPERRDGEVQWYDDIEKIAKEHKISILSEEDLYHQQFDILLCVDYHHILKSKHFLQAKIGSFNIHGSLLPKYRGVAPYIRAVCNGEKEVGVTLHEIDSGVDTGDIVVQKRFKVNEFDLITDVMANHTRWGLECFKEFLNQIEYNKEQDEYIYPQRKQSKGDQWQNWDYEIDGELNVRGSARKFLNKVRMLSYPFPRAFIKNAAGEKYFVSLEKP